MDPTTLENLLADKALGALPPEFESLLEAYLHDHPEAQTQSAQLDAAIALARRALVQTRPHRMPQFPAHRLRQQEQRFRHARVLRLTSGLAACLAAGVFIGSVMFARGGGEETAGPSAPSQLAESSAPAESLPAAPSFWSVTERAEAATTAGPQQAASLTWDSPVRVPNLRGPS